MQCHSQLPIEILERLWLFYLLNRGCIKVRRLEVLTVGLLCVVGVSLIVNVVVLMENQELRRLYDELYQTSLSTTISPPISKSEAVHIALEYGGWNETTLKDMVVTARLEYSKFYNSTKERSYEHLYDVTDPVSDYSPVRIGDVTYRYVWVVVVHQVGPIRSIPPPGLYYVDAAAGEVIPTSPFL